MNQKKITEIIEDNINKPSQVESNDLGRGENEILKTIKDSMSYFETYLFPSKIEIIKQKYLNAIDRSFWMKKMGMKNRSNRIYPLISSVHDTYLANLLEVETTQRLSPRRPEGIGLANSGQELYDWARDAANYERKMLPIWSESLLLGTSYGRVGMSVNKHEILTKNKGKSFEVRKPSMDHVSYFQLFYDPFLDSFDKCPWKAYRYITNEKDICNRYAFLYDQDYNWYDVYRPKVKGSSPISQYDYTRVYSSKNYEREILKLKKIGDYDDRVNNKIFTVDYTNNDTREVIEFWSEDQLIVFVNQVEVYNGINPYPFSGDPFSIIVNEEVPCQIQGIGIGDKLMNHQINANMIYSGLEDIMRMNLYPMYIASPGALTDAAGRAIKSLTYEPEKVIEDKSKLGNAGIETFKMVDINASQVALSRLQSLVSEAYEIVGLNTYTQGGNGKMERSAAGVQQKTAIIRTRLLPMISSMNTFNTKVFNQWLAILLFMYPDGFSYKIVGKDGVERFKQIDLESIVYEFDIVSESEAMRAATRQLRATQAADAINKLLPLNVDPVTGLPIYHLEDILQEFLENQDFEIPSKYSDEEIKDLLRRKREIEESINPTPTEQPNDALSSVDQGLPPMDVNTPSFEGQSPQEVLAQLGGVSDQIPVNPEEQAIIEEMTL